MNRLCIYPKEISTLLGKSNSYACNLVRIIKAAYAIKASRPITIEEFSKYMDLPYKTVFDSVNGVKAG